MLANQQIKLSGHWIQQGDTLIHYAARFKASEVFKSSSPPRGQETGSEVIQVLLSKGADATITNASGKTAFDVACESGSLDAIFLLLQHGVGNSIITPKDNQE